MLCPWNIVETLHCLNIIIVIVIIIEYFALVNVLLGFLFHASLKSLSLGT